LDPNSLAGPPVVDFGRSGTRVMVWQVLDLLAAGGTSAEIRAAFPTLTAAHIRAALEYASALTRESPVPAADRAELPA
jgi:uncharacterized protein (DUF433 family)